jgi:hypothetical protein
VLLSDLNNSNKQTSPAIRARLLQQLLHTHVTPGNLNLVLQACCARLSAASRLTSALPNAAVQSVCVAVQTHSDVDHATQIFLSSWSPIELPIMAWMAQGNRCCCCELCTFDLAAETDQLHDCLLSNKYWCFCSFEVNLGSIRSCQRSCANGLSCCSEHGARLRGCICVLKRMFLKAFICPTARYMRCTCGHGKLLLFVS